MQQRKTVIFSRVLFVFLIVSLAFFGVYDFLIPDSISFFKGENCEDCFNTSVFTAEIQNETDVNGNDLYDSCKVGTRLFGVIPMKTVDADVFSEVKLIPGGFPFGVKLYTKGVIVVGISDVETEKGSVSPAREAGLREKDVIISIDGEKVNTAKEVSEKIAQSNGKKLSITLNRKGVEEKIELTPAHSSGDNLYKAGIWIRDSTAGIGTVTFIDPRTNEFAGLGHGICDVDTGELMPLLRGNVVDVKLNGVNKGKVGDPGELKGIFCHGKIGELKGNTPYGVFGTLSSVPEQYKREPLPIALKKDIKTGSATIYCTVGEKPEEYSAEIVKINPANTDTKNFVIKITDERLLEATGGIVQGMSGSPVIQNGRIVGAVTHVLVNDPTSGYGIFIENMLKNIPE